MSIYVNANVNISELIRDADLSDQWELLQLLWDELKRSGGNEDWQSFFDDNGIAKKED